ncbi:homeodomain-interacting protein kinase 2-like [Paralichthys olivaceus]|uniref:homeodomain-interacting protein kinase 2-like n=1 Tax=Paralichthys olivaceus TaxID=8255 RepID=UPI003750D4EE
MIPLYLSQELDILSPCRYSCIHSVRTYCTCCSNTHTTPTEVKEGKEEGKQQKPHFKSFDKTDKMTEVRKSGKSKKPKGTILCSSTTRYLVKERIGEGGFSSVVRAVNLSTSEEVAIKILKDKQDAKKEYAMLKVLKVLDPEKNNLVHFIEKFRYNGQTCLVFEKLDMDLHSMNEMLGRGMTLHEIRPIAHQLVTTLKALKSIGVVHSDIKPDNVMVVDPHATPVRVKLIDFGLSSNIPSELGELCQPLGYRAPEVSLGLPFSEAIDMWGLACVLLFLYLNAHPFPSCEYQTVKAVVGLLGLPADHLLKAGMYTDMFFKEDQYWSKPGWWLKISEEFYSKKNKTEKVLFKTLDDLITLYPLSEGSMELSDRRAFFSLIKGLLEIDPDRRLTPEEALLHPFLTMSHILEHAKPYLFTSLSKMGNLGMEEDDSECSPCDMAQEEPEEEEPEEEKPEEETPEEETPEEEKPEEEDSEEDEPEEKASAFSNKHRHRTRADKSALAVSVSAADNKHRTYVDKSASTVSAVGNKHRHRTRADKLASAVSVSAVDNKHRTYVDKSASTVSAVGNKHRRRTRADKSASTVSVSAVGNKHRTRADKSASAVSAFSSYRLHTRADKKINDRSRTVTVEKPLKKDKKSFCRIVKKAFIKILKKIKKIGRR